MVQIVVKTWYPPNKAMEITKSYMETLKKIPYESFEKHGTHAYRASKHGIEGISIVEVDKGKLEEAMVLVAKREFEISKVDGYRYQIDTMFSLEEALAMAGLKMQ